MTHEVRQYTKGTTVLTPGLWRMRADEYHADPCPGPSLSSSVLIAMLECSPLHVWHDHPRLGNKREDETSKAAEFGSAVHKLALGFGSQIVIIDAKDYRGKAAQDQRNAAIAAGHIPILVADEVDAQLLAASMRASAEACLGCSMDDCLREVVIIWQDANGNWRRAMVDVMTPDLRRCVDLKSTQASAAPDPSIKRLYDAGYHIQEAHYVSGLDAIDPDGAGRRSFAFIFGEASSPYAVGPPLEITEQGRHIARVQREMGTALWDACLKHNRWPGYPQEPHMAEPPSWYAHQWQLRMEGDSSLNPVTE